MEGDPAETVIPLLEEHLRVLKRDRPTGRVRVAVTTGSETRMVEEVLRHRRVEIERVAVDRPVDAVPPIREEADSLVIPVVEEVLVVERRLVLREEIRLRLRTEERHEAVPVTLRRQQASIERLPPDAPPLANNGQEAHRMRTITGLFDSRPDAERAVEYMVQHHDIDRNLIQVHAAGNENATAGTFDRRDESHHGFVAALRDLGLPDEDSITYAEGMRRGGILVSVRAPEDKLDAVADAFESNGAVDLDARQTEWRQGGWTGGGGGFVGDQGTGADGSGGRAAPTGRADAGQGLVGSRSAGSSATPNSMPAANPDAATAGWTGGGGAIGSTAATAPGSQGSGTGSTYAGTSYVGARATDEDITKPVNAGIASSPPVRPAGPAALAAASAGASTSALRGSGADAERASHEGLHGPGSGAGPAAGSAAAGEQPLPSRQGATSPAGHGTGTAAQGLSGGVTRPGEALQAGREGLRTDSGSGMGGPGTGAMPGGGMGRSAPTAAGTQGSGMAAATPGAAGSMAMGKATGMGAPSGTATGMTDLPRILGQGGGQGGGQAAPTTGMAGGTGTAAAYAGSPTPQTSRAQPAAPAGGGQPPDLRASGAPLAGSQASGSRPADTRAAGTTGRDEAIPIVEERLRVGKRDVTLGRVRVRSYVVETPVEEQVRLREEHVQVQRRPVDRPLGAGEAATFQDRVIEATESAEEAVIDKQARVREEVVIRKDASERTQTVSDTVRRTEVEIEDERRRAAGTTPPRDPAR
ncbi:YsnF/AvaK domain-containing protein [Paracraurococcus lichenis]|uniref:YsnF/AvaK domain-containing protein n=1 Tax=Paracraurococcus lichenis TaxID=3064888 RepID=A0ABT9DY87_9PROT|nr:YsnF/AvaK domain-containing protein [Paracraurococcus sp. LOR1-02]MDO9708872.1 YsnF/AvaK domain-containing protein [Paracraurococcus sp. LOR1-02]